MDLTTIPWWVPLKHPVFAPERAGQKTSVFWITQDLHITLFGGQQIVIPVDFETDGASVPKILQGIFPAIGDHLLADVIHDYLYGTNLVPKAQADSEFWQWMHLLRPLPKSRLDNYLRYIAVVWFGRGAYRQYGKAKSNPSALATNGSSK